MTSSKASSCVYIPSASQQRRSSDCALRLIPSITAFNGAQTVLQVLLGRTGTDAGCRSVVTLSWWRSPKAREPRETQADRCLCPGRVSRLPPRRHSRNPRRVAGVPRAPALKPPSPGPLASFLCASHSLSLIRARLCQARHRGDSSRAVCLQSLRKDPCAFFHAGQPRVPSVCLLRVLYRQHGTRLGDTPMLGPVCGSPGGQAASLCLWVSLPATSLGS